MVLAAGGSRRLGTPKQLLESDDGETLVHRAARVALALASGPVFVVVGAESERVRAALSDLSVHIVENAEWPAGMGTSVREGTRAVMERAPACLALLLMTCDMPTVDALHLEQLVARFDGGAVRVASAYGEAVGNPAIVSRSEWGELTALDGDRGARKLFARSGTVTVPLKGGALDLDTPEDVARWRGRPVQ